MEYWNKRSQTNIALKSFWLITFMNLSKKSFWFHVVFAKKVSMFQTLKREYLFDIVIWLSSLHVVFVQNNIRFLLHFPIRVSNQHYKNSVTLKNQCIWSIFRPDSKQYKIGVSAIRGSVFGGFAVWIFNIKTRGNKGLFILTIT